MGEWVYTQVLIGGRMTKAVHDELMEHGEAEFEEVDEVTSTHILFSGERNYGNADETEAFCREHSLPYHLNWASASGVFDAGIHYWRPGMDAVAELSATDDGEPMIPLRELRDMQAQGHSLGAVIHLLSDGEAARVPPVEIVEEAAESPNSESAT